MAAVPRLAAALAAAGLAACASAAAPGGPFDYLFTPPPLAGTFLHVSSTDTTGGNRDYVQIAPGDSAVLLDLDGAGVIRRLWLTVASDDPDYLRRMAVRMYWDGETNPSVDVPLGDFFGDGFSKPNYAALPMGIASGGFYCYLPMPFARHARIVVTNGTGRVVDALYYNIDLERLPRMAPGVRTLHAFWHRDRAPARGVPHLIAAARGTGEYVGTVFEVQSYRANLWFLEGDEIIHTDGALRGQGTGTEDYFNSGWYFDRGPFTGPFHGLVEKDDSTGRIVAYRWHLLDPIPFRDSLRMEIEHGTSSEETADYATVGYWYQTEPHAPLPPLPPPDARRVARVLVPPDAVSGAALDVHPAGAGLEIRIPVPRPDRYRLTVYPMGERAGGSATYAVAGLAPRTMSLAADGDSTVLPPVALGELAAHDTVVLRITGSGGLRPAGVRLVPVRMWAREWNVVGPFPSPRVLGTEHVAALDSAWEPERDPDLARSYAVAGSRASWRLDTAAADGMVDLVPLFTPSDWVAAYAQAFLYSPDDRTATLLLGADDGHALWVNGTPVSRRDGRHLALPDDVPVAVRLHAGWNRVLLKIGNLDGGWAFGLRAADPDGVLRWSAEPR